MEVSELKKKTFHSVIWTVARIGSSNVLTFAVFFLLARILKPADFGVYALAGVFLEFGRTLSTAGLEEAITQNKHLDDELATSAFWANLAFALLVAATMWALAPLYARAIGEPPVGPILQWLSVVVPIYALGGIHMARKLRDFGHRSVAARTIASGLLGGGGAVLAALHGFGVWSLVIQSGVNEVVGVVFAWHAFPWLPRPRVALSRLKEVGSFSASLTLALLLRLMLARVQDLIIGIFMGAPAVGTYRIAWRILELISQITIFPVMTVSLVTLARLQDDAAKFANAYGRMLGLTALFTIPAMFGFGMLSNDLIIALFGERWAASAPVANILGFMAVPLLLSFFVGPMLAAAGRSRASAEVAIAQFVATVAMSLIAAPFGLIAMAASYAIRGYAMIPYLMRVMRRETGITGAAIGRSILPPFWASLFMVAVLAVVEPALHHAIDSRALNIVIGVIAGSAAYTVGLLLFARRMLASQYAAIRPLLMGAPPALAIDQVAGPVVADAAGR